MNGRFEKSGTTGKIVERELFGESRYHTYKENMEVGGDWKRYGLEERIRLLKRLQPFESIDQAPEFAKTVHGLVAEKLGINSKLLRFYTAVESPIDWSNKIDGFFQVLKGGEYIRVTIDITINPEKPLPKFPADIPDFLVPRDGLSSKVDKDQFLEYAISLADQVVAIFRQQGLISLERRPS